MITYSSSFQSGQDIRELVRPCRGGHNSAKNLVSHDAINKCRAEQHTPFALEESVRRQSLVDGNHALDEDENVIAVILSEALNALGLERRHACAVYDEISTRCHHT